MQDSAISMGNTNLLNDKILWSRFEKLCRTHQMTTLTALHALAQEAVEKQRLPEDTIAAKAARRREGMQAFRALRQEAVESGLTMTDENINAIIQEVRDENAFEREDA